MACSEFNFSIDTCTQVDVGFDFSKVFTITDGGGAVDLTNLTFQLIVKDRTGGTALLTLDEVGDDLTSGLYIADPVTGVLKMIITDTDSLTSGNYPYEMTQTDASSRKSIFLQGYIQFFGGAF